MKKQEILEKDIQELGINQKLEKVLVNDGVTTIQDVWMLKRTDLKKKGLSDSDIMQITIKLQLNGLDLNRKIY